MLIIKKYPRSFAAAVALHIFLAIIFLANIEFDSEPAIPEQKEVDVVQATAVNEEQVLAELAKLKAAELAKKKKEDARVNKLERDADKAKKQREREQRRLAELEKKRKAEQKKKQQLEKESKNAEQKRKQEEKKQREAEKQRKIAEQKQKDAEKATAKAEKEQKAAETKRRKELEQQRIAEAQRRKADEERKRAEAKKRKAEEERKRAEEIERKAKEKALRAIEEQQRREEEIERQRQMAEEQKRLKASSDKKAQKIINRYVGLIKRQVENNWRKPSTATPGMSCDVHVRLMPTGDIITVEAKKCTGGDAIFQRSVEDAVRAAAPLSLPTDKALFSQFREINFKFKPEN